MAFYSPVSWMPYLPWVGAIYITYDAFAPNIPKGSISSQHVISLIVVLTSLGMLWKNQVMKYVPEPYMDEIFHIPQAQAYCVGDFHVWDPKLTTPPGLYIFSTIFCNLARIRSCTVSTLRHFNTLSLVFLFQYAITCRARLQKLLIPDANGLHIAFNLALFPPLFFFSGLYYTDVLSTCVVLRMYRLFLERGGGLWLYIAGIVSLSMRQTNIFWAVIFMGGLDVVRALKQIESEAGDNDKGRECWSGITAAAYHQYSRGEIHDVTLKSAEIYDFALCAVSIAITIIYHPITVLRRLYPYIFLLITFALFVIWNGSIVLGDKAAHVATLHLPQMLYVWAFIAFFSFPLLIPSAIALLKLPFSGLRPTPLRVILAGITIYAAVKTSLLIVHFNTLVHPFILADNRHYMFYVFRYTILRHWGFKYALVPIYLLAFYLCKLTLAGTFTTSKPSSQAQPTTKPTASASNSAAEKKNVIRFQKPVAKSTITPSTSYFLVLLLATALSLITAPLVEPRYFILPWLFWRLHLPSFQLTTSQPSLQELKPAARKITNLRSRRRKVWASIKYWAWEGHDPRLWLETLWFLLINTITCYIFLTQPFTWSSTPGAAQRFMW
ncbi:DIE2/ALG10 family-domain-containing protein [Calycina marina]|uniref:Dol-P-Glc:Glc(2)Man(9)GlcNAc(2)-PP-Dol alpha-1,2-glucosyltransferase n=1 Tax=Calycina marina TaxID=1763456 RepID=A0A9P8CDV3_9HELO|nr:DIE2/ALG10 family-domain-containing protein [Calycina marina]